MAKLYKGFKRTGTENETKWDEGLESTEARPKRLLELLISVTAHQGNQILVDHERERLADPYDYHFDTDEQLASANPPRSSSKLSRIEIDQIIPIGQRIKVGLKCGATASDLYGVYVYELTK